MDALCLSVFNGLLLLLMFAKLDMYNKQIQMLTLASLRHLEWVNIFDSAWSLAPGA